MKVYFDVWNGNGDDGKPSQVTFSGEVVCTINKEKFDIEAVGSKRLIPSFVIAVDDGTFAVIPIDECRHKKDLKRYFVYEREAIGCKREVHSLDDVRRIIKSDFPEATNIRIAFRLIHDEGCGEDWGTIKYHVIMDHQDNKNAQVGYVNFYDE